jgi:hypothetical protein
VNKREDCSDDEQNLVIDDRMIIGATGFQGKKKNMVFDNDIFSY